MLRLGGLVVCGVVCAACIAEQDLGDRPQSEPPDRIGGRILWRGQVPPDDDGIKPGTVAVCDGCPEGMTRLGSAPRVEEGVQPGGYYCAGHAAPPPQAPDCGTDYATCADSCVDTDTHPDHCGGCGVICTTPGFGHRMCTDGACAPCGAGFLKCTAGVGPLCVDPSTDRGNCGACGTPCDGVCQDGACLASEDFTVLTNVVGDDFALDEHFVFATVSDEGDPSSSRIVRALRTGSDPVVIAYGAQARRLIADDVYVYWTDAVGGGVYRADKAGTEVTLLAVAGRPLGIALHGDDVYWADEGAATASPIQGGSIQRVTKTGGSPTLVVPLIGWSGREIAIDSKHVYFTQIPKSGSLAPILSRIPLEGGEPEVVGSSTSIGIAVDDDLVYGLEHGASVSLIQSYTTGEKVSKQNVAEVVTSTPGPVAISKSYVYFGTYRSPKCGGAIGNFLPPADSIKTADGYVYWTSGGRLMRRPE